MEARTRGKDSESVSSGRPGVLGQAVEELGRGMEVVRGQTCAMGGGGACDMMAMSCTLALDGIYM
jgi:hypothetical protein